MADIFRADHVGSLLRPPEVHEARAAYQAGRLDADELRAVENRAILEALERQRAAGVSVFTDGEFRRTGFQNDLIEAVDGFVMPERPAVVRVWQGPGGEPIRAGHAAGRWGQAAAGAGPDREPAWVPAGTCAGSRQNDAAQPQPVPGHRLPARASATGSIPPARTCSGRSPGSSKQRLPRCWRPGSTTSRSTRRATVTTSIHAGGSTCGSWARTRTRCSRRR